MNYDFILQIVSTLGLIIALIANAYLYSRIARSETVAVSRDEFSKRYYDPYGYYSYDRLGTPLRDFLVVTISRAEERFGVRLTQAARDMLIIPIMEASQEEKNFDLQRATLSIFDILETMVPPERGTPSLHRPLNAKAVVRAFHKKFCNIPPFCDGEGPDRK